MRYVIKLVGLADGRETGRDGEYLKSCDVDARGGLGLILSEPSANDALKFDTIRAALDYWQTQSRVTPVRDDGKPNRPLTAYTIQVMAESYDTDGDKEQRR